MILKYSLIIPFFSVALFSCMKDTEKIPDATNLRYYDTLLIDQLQRTFLLNLPPNYDDTSGISLVIALHGGGGSADQVERNYLITEKANKEHFAVVYPEGVKSDGLLGARTWNAGTCCDYAVEKNINDVKFISTLIDELLVRHPHLNSKKVYVTGMSNGAIMSYRLACEIPYKIAAIAPVAGTMAVTSPCISSRAVSILHIHSVLDEKVPYNGGRSTFGFLLPAVEKGIDQWLQNDACNSTQKTVTKFPLYTHTIWKNCDQKSTIEIYLTEDGGHSWPGGVYERASADEPSKAFIANDLIWSFFQKHELP